MLCGYYPSDYVNTTGLNIVCGASSPNNTNYNSIKQQLQLHYLAINMLNNHKNKNGLIIEVKPFYL